ncbi:hypothetical protein PAXRUDRAFT_16895 [Paxillus rubicundulus Ve08.2h10]|uniref:Uncharacterized protein n=1 Tax=Paxillus rubicundulus Ve08.2h10 TaxID=930991 RepID=A0A0D0D4A0_9AGAM|nr:hypothetical protein PAXRUDRAFT_16895 [Paxillus rubicundulus Ve08.2h10]
MALSGNESKLNKTHSNLSFPLLGHCGLLIIEIRITINESILDTMNLSDSIMYAPSSPLSMFSLTFPVGESIWSASHLNFHVIV